MEEGRRTFPRNVGCNEMDAIAKELQPRNQVCDASINVVRNKAWKCICTIILLFFCNSRAAKDTQGKKKWVLTRDYVFSRQSKHASGNRDSERSCQIILGWAPSASSSIMHRQSSHLPERHIFDLTLITWM